MKLAIYAKVDLKTVNLLALLRRFRSLDDDADLCLAAWERMGGPVYQPEVDFKPAWGIEHQCRYDRSLMDVYYIPPAIPPHQSTVGELFDYFSKGVKLVDKQPDPTWEPNILPRYVDRVNLSIGPGSVEVGGGLLSYKSPVAIRCGGASRALHVKVPRDFYIPEKPLEEWRGKLSKLMFNPACISMVREGREGILFYLPECISNHYIVDVKLAEAIRGFITSGLFPIIPFDAMDDDPEKLFPKVTAKPSKEAVKKTNVIGNVEFVRRGMLREDAIVERLNF